MRVGGHASLWVEPAHPEDLLKIVDYSRSKMTDPFADPVLKRCVHLTFVGCGSNLLVRDAGISGIALHLGAHGFSQIEIGNHHVHVGAGTRLKHLVMACRRARKTGLEFLEEIPGSVGGALRMNAGAMGHSIFDVVERVRFMDLEGKFFEKPPSELHVQYRTCQGLRNHLILSATLRVAPGDLREIDERLKAFEEKRWSSQPAAPSAGCIFKNLPEGSTGRLIDECGLKGLTFGKARVSEVHGNFIVNTGGATAAEVITLISMVQDRVQKATRKKLETEIIIIGDEEWSF